MNKTQKTFEVNYIYLRGDTPEHGKIDMVMSEGDRMVDSLDKTIKKVFSDSEIVMIDSIVEIKQ